MAESTARRYLRHNAPGIVHNSARRHPQLRQLHHVSMCPKYSVSMASNIVTVVGITMSVVLNVPTEEQKRFVTVLIAVHGIQTQDSVVRHCVILAHRH